MRILVTGSRVWVNWQLSHDILLHLDLIEGLVGNEITLVHGACPSGLDSFAGDFARMIGWTEEPHPADWAKHGKAAGFIRNQEMVDLGADVCLAFFQVGAGNKGTTDCANRASKAGIPVVIYWSDGEVGDREPSRSGPDSPPAGGPGVQGPGGKDYASENPPDDSGGIEALTPSEKFSGIAGTGILVYDMVLPKRPTGKLWTPFRDALAGPGRTKGA